MVHTGHGNSTLSASLRQTINESIPPDVDLCLASSVDWSQLVRLGADG